MVSFKLLFYIKLMKGKAFRKHSLHEKTAASVLLKLFISSNERCHSIVQSTDKVYTKVPMPTAFQKS